MTTQSKKIFPVRVFLFYKEGFASLSTLGKTLWIIILIKLFIMFFVLKLFFFPNYLNQFESEDEKAEHVSKELINRKAD